jgi:hypothetical protein
MLKRRAYTAPIALLAAAMFAARPATAQVPTFAEVTGHDFGERVTQHHEAVLYLQTLAETSDRVRIMDQGESWEGRRLLVAIVTSPQNHQRLDAIQQAAQRLGDPRVTTPDEAAAIMGEQPVILWYGGSIHGFELSGAEGLLKLLEHLTTRDDPATLDVPWTCSRTPSSSSIRRSTPMGVMRSPT